MEKIKSNKRPKTTWENTGSHRRGPPIWSLQVTAPPPGEAGHPGCCMKSVPPTHTGAPPGPQEARRPSETQQRPLPEDSSGPSFSPARRRGRAAAPPYLGSTGPSPSSGVCVLFQLLVPRVRLTESGDQPRVPTTLPQLLLALTSHRTTDCLSKLGNGSLSA